MSSPVASIDPATIRLRVRRVLMIGQVLAGVGMGSTLSVGAILATELSGSPGWSGMAATMATLGSALAALPLANLARRSGRSWSLALGAWVAALGALTVVASAVSERFWVLLVGLAMVGVGTAVNLQARFAATDVSNGTHRATDLSLVVWATTVGAVSGPNLIEPGSALGGWLGLPALAGPFVITAAAQFAASLVYRFGLRPDPLVVSTRWAIEHADDVEGPRDVTDRPDYRASAFIAIALSHASMVAVMAMTPVHLVDHGASLAVVGFTISLHIAGMFALSPVFGRLADRFGRVRIVVLGQFLLALSLFATGLGSENEGWVVVGLIVLGLGWSAATVAGSALLTESTPLAIRTRIQGLSDVVMSASGALAGALSGIVLLWVGYDGLSIATLGLVAIVLARIVWAHRPRIARAAQEGVSGQ